MADNSLITQEQYNEDMKRLYDEKIYPYLNGATHTGCVPLGTILPYFGETAPTHFLICDGTTYNKADYPELASHLLALTYSSPYVVSGDDTKFKVPDLRGEFLRGSGTNSHTNQGSGADVGVHQDATEITRICANDNLLVGFKNGNWVGARNHDGSVKYTTTGDHVKASITTGSVAGEASASLVRPTNTSVTYIIAYRNAYIDLALDGFPINITQPTDGQLLMWDATANRWVNGGHKYSTEEHVVGKWIDGRNIYEKSIYLSAEITTTANSWTYIIPINLCPSNIYRIINGIVTRVNHSGIITGAINFNSTSGIGLQTTLAYSLTTNDTITIQYTKTTDII